MLFRTKYNAAPTPGLVTTRPSLTEQSHKRSCDINLLVARYQQTGILGDPSQYLQQHYGDFTEIGDYQEQQNAMAKARQSFEALPSSVRDAFANNPGKFIDALFDPSQRKKLEVLGLVKAATPAATPMDPVDQTVSEEIRQKAEGTITT